MLQDELELDPRILQKNLEITKLTQQVDSLKSQALNDNIILQEQTDEVLLSYKVVDEMSTKLRTRNLETVHATKMLDDKITQLAASEYNLQIAQDRLDRFIHREEQVPMYMLGHLNELYNKLCRYVLDGEEDLQCIPNDLSNLKDIIKKLEI